jgi:hypothetical protein
VLFERGQNILFGKVAEPVKAVLAGAVLKVKKLSATLTLEKFHRATFVVISGPQKRNRHLNLCAGKASAMLQIRSFMVCHERDDARP